MGYGRADNLWFNIETRIRLTSGRKPNEKAFYDFDLAPRVLAINNLIPPLDRGRG